MGVSVGLMRMYEPSKTYIFLEKAINKISQINDD